MTLKTAEPLIPRRAEPKYSRGKACDGRLRPKAQLTTDNLSTKGHASNGLCHECWDNYHQEKGNLVNTSELITRAEHAIRTGQPRLTTLYMTKALHQIDEARTLNKRDLRAAQAKLRAHRMTRSIGDYFNGIKEIAAEAFKGITDAVEATRYMYQADYTLAGPSKGTP